MVRGLCESNVAINDILAAMHCHLTAFIRFIPAKISSQRRDTVNHGEVVHQQQDIFNQQKLETHKKNKH